VRSQSCCKRWCAPRTISRAAARTAVASFLAALDPPLRIEDLRLTDLSEPPERSKNQIVGLTRDDRATILPVRSASSIALSAAWSS
jgi:hypothetical protein